MKLIFLFFTAGALAFAQTSQNKKIAEKIEGNFLGNGKTIVATAIKIKEGKGNPAEDGTPDEYEIRFSDSQLKPIKAGCCEVILINEGDLNHNGNDEISVYQAPMNGCTYTMTIYSSSNGKWNKIIDTFLVPTACEPLSKDDLQKMIARDKKGIYYYQKEMDDENGKLIKKKVSDK